MSPKGHLLMQVPWQVCPMKLRPLSLTLCHWFEAEPLVPGLSPITNYLTTSYQLQSPTYLLLSWSSGQLRFLFLLFSEDSNILKAWFTQGSWSLHARMHLHLLSAEYIWESKHRLLKWTMLRKTLHWNFGLITYSIPTTYVCMNNNHGIYLVRCLISNYFLFTLSSSWSYQMILGNSFPRWEWHAAVGQVMRQVGDVHTWGQVLGLS